MTTFAHWRRARQASSAVLLAPVLCTGFAALSAPLQAQGPPGVVPVSATVSEGLLPPQPTFAGAYVIGQGDTLSISYPYNAELNRVGPVGPDGRISLPFLGAIVVGGKSTDEVAGEIERDLYVAGIAEHAYPNVQITTYSYAHDIYVGGEVGRPGLVILSSEMDPLQAVIAAGGFLNTARTGKIAIVRRMAENRPRVIYIDVHDYLRGKPGTHTVQLAPYDVVYVPKSKIAEIDEWMDEYLNKTLPFSRSLNLNSGSGGGTVVAGK